MFGATADVVVVSDPKLPGILKTTLLEWQAAAIADPVEKLRFLRRETQSTRRSLPAKALGTVLLLVSIAILAATLQTRTGTGVEVVAEFVPHPVAAPVAPAPRSAVWRVEENAAQEVFSNGLRIETGYVAPGDPRVYSIFRLDGSWGSTPEIHSVPAGIVFHTTEGEQIPLEERRNTDLRHVVRETVQHIRRNRSYHFLVDKFGRVFRVVPETDVAFHAGKSVWADERGIYAGLNDSFLGIAFEARTADVSDGAYLSAAQISTGKLLVDMLIDKYNFPVTNCITHSQVSVNPDNMKIGAHTDAAGDFPFEQLGLPDNHALAIPSIYLFGFDYDPLFLRSTGFRLWRGLLLADELIRQRALAQGVSIRAFKTNLRAEYRRIAAAVELQHMSQEKG